MRDAARGSSGVRNYYYLIVGLLFILFAVTHELNGRATVLATVGATSMVSESKTAVYYVWHILTAENLLFGVALLAMALRSEWSGSRLTAQLIAAILVARWGVIFATTLAHNAHGVAGLLGDSVAILVCVGLILLGSRKQAAAH